MSKDILPDDLLKEALRKAQEIKTAAYDKEIAQEEEHVFSKEYREKMEKLLEEFENKQESKEEKKVYSIKKKNLKLKILLIAAIVMLMGSMTVMAVEPLREAFYQLIEQIFPDHTYISFETIEDQINKQNMEVDLNKYPLKLERVPKGYTINKEEDWLEFGFYEYMQIFQNTEGKNLIYKQILIEEIDIRSLVVTSDGTAAEEILICGESAYLLTDEMTYHTIIYPKDGFIYVLGGYDEVKVLIECLESIF